MEHHSHGADHVVGQLSELAALMLLNESMKQIALSWLKKNSTSQFVSDNFWEIRTLIESNSPFLFLVTDRISSTWLAGLDALGARVVVYEYREYIFSYGEGFPPKTRGEMLMQFESGFPNCSEVIKNTNSGDDLFLIRHPRAVGIINMSERIKVKYGNDLYEAIVYSTPMEMYFKFTRQIKVSGIRLLLSSTEEGFLHLTSNQKRL